ncbi:MAG: midcut-by-XrtH protein [Chromatiales bacterium]|nr:midcut-by-XrtH protein [Chromatiales bacterium]
MKSRSLTLGAIALSAALTSLEVAAGGNGGAGMIYHEPFARQVPTASGIALVALALLLATLAFRLVRRPSGEGSRFLTLAIAATAIAAGGSGVKLISDAVAAPPPDMINAAGGQVTVPADEMCYTVNNLTGAPQQITQMTANPPWQLTSCTNGGAFVPAANGGIFVGTCQAAPGTILQPGQNCTIYALNLSANGGNGGMMVDP